MKSLKFGIAAIAMVLVLAVPPASAGDDDREGRQGLAGTWYVKLVPQDCITGTPFPIPPIPTLFTFHGDGTLSATLENYAASLTNRSLSHGIWKRISDRRPGVYTMKFTHLRYDFISGVYMGTQEAVSQVTLDWNGNKFTAASSTRGFDPTGAQQYSSCASLSGERMQLP